MDIILEEHNIAFLDVDVVEDENGECVIVGNLVALDDKEPFPEDPKDIITDYIHELLQRKIEESLGDASSGSDNGL